MTDIMCRRKSDTEARRFVAGAYSLRFKLAFLLVLPFVIALITVSGCDGDGSNGDKGESIIFDVEVFGFEFADDFFGNCSEANTTTLLLKLRFEGDDVSGKAELMGFDRIGRSTKIAGIVEGDDISLDPFSVSVDDGTNVAGFGPSIVTFSFSSFEGMFSDTDGDQSPDEIAGTFSARLGEVLEGDIVICDGNLTGEFLAVAEGN